MFHEFGHALHGLFAAQIYPTLSGTSVARDFVEFPSQFNEHWALDPKILPHYAVHYQTGQTIPQSLVDFMEFYLFNYFKPGQYQHTNTGQLGQNLLVQIGCTACHIPNMVITRDRRIADVETSFDPQRGVFNQLFAVASLLVSENDDGSGHPTIKIPNRNSFMIRNFYADMKRHDVGPAFYERNFDGTLTRRFMTEPLWGVGSSAPYGHDGRSVNLREVILRHGGEAQSSRNSFANLSETQQDQVLKFLNELVLFPPDDTASNLDPGDRNNTTFPQRGHGSIRLPELFNDPAELE
jgi:hypothetical protein